MKLRFACREVNRLRFSSIHPAASWQTRAEFVADLRKAEARLPRCTCGLTLGHPKQGPDCAAES